jgi:hypothetical protein
VAQPAPSTTAPASGQQTANAALAPGKQAAEVPPPAARAAAAAAIVAAFAAFLAAARQADRQWLTVTLSEAPPQDVTATLAEEERRGAEFAEAASARLAGELDGLLAIPDQQVREAKMRVTLEREKRYARQHSEAMAARAFAALDRVDLRKTSPAGAYWQLDPTVKEHTAGCLFMGGKFWPWAVLDRVRPPRHAGCPCKLRSYQTALASGWITPEDVRSVQDAVREAAGVVMEAAVAEAVTRELELRDALIESGLADPAALAAIPVSA